MSNLYRGPSKDASYQISIHLAKWLQRRRIFQKSTNQKQELSMVVMFDNRSGRNEQSLQRTCHRCFLTRFSSFGQVVLEEKIKKYLLILSRSVNKHGYHRNLVRIIYGMSSMKIAHFVLIGQQTWSPHAILVSDWSISKKSSPLKLLSHMN